MGRRMSGPPDQLSDGNLVAVSRRLVVTADDVGLDPGMTAGAIRAHREGIGTACSVVATGRAFDDAIARSRDVPSLGGVGHLPVVAEIAWTAGALLARHDAEFV